MAESAQPGDGAIIVEVLAGNRQRFALIVERYQRPLFRFAMSRLGREDWAEEVTQETLLCAYKSLHSYDSRFSFRTWLWTIQLNQCRRLVSKAARRLPLEVDPAQFSEPATGEEQSPPFKLFAKQRAEQLQRLLAELPSEQADALRLRFYGGLKYREVAEAMACSLSTAKNRVRWGLTSLSEQLVPGEML